MYDPYAIVPQTASSYALRGGKVVRNRADILSDRGEAIAGWGLYASLDDMLAGREWFADQYSVLDPYGFVFYTWGVRRELPMEELKHYTTFKDRMLARPAVKRVVEDEKVKV